MAREDVVTNEYLNDPERFADLLNVYAFQGKCMVQEQDVYPWEASLSPAIGILRRRFLAAKYRDVIKKTVFGTNFVLIGAENQSEIHYAMPIRGNTYDALEYDAQWRKIRKLHQKKRDLRGAEFLSGFSKKDRVKPVVTIVLYWGLEPWDGARNLHDLMDFTDIPEEVRSMANNYSLNLIEVRRHLNPELFRTDLRSVFGFIQHAGNKHDLKAYVFEHEADFSNLADDAFDVIAEVTGAGELDERKKKVQNPEGGYDMCKAIKDMIEDSKEEGKAEGELHKLIQLVCKKVQKGQGCKTIADALEEPEEEIQKLMEIVNRHAPDYDEDAIYREFCEKKKN